MVPFEIAPQVVPSFQAVGANLTTQHNTLTIFSTRALNCTTVIFKTIVSYDSINKIKPRAFPQHWFLFTTDIDSLQTNLNAESGLQAVGEILQRHPDPREKFKKSYSLLTSITRPSSSNPQSVLTQSSYLLEITTKHDTPKFFSNPNIHTVSSINILFPPQTHIQRFGQISADPVSQNLFIWQSLRRSIPHRSITHEGLFQKIPSPIHHNLQQFNKQIQQIQNT